MSIKLKSANGISLEVKDGEILHVSGKKGEKILGIISGLEKISSGSATISGYDVSSMKRGERVQFFRDTVSFLQSYDLQKNLSVRDNISLPGFFSGMSTREMKTRTKNIAKKFSVLKILKKKPAKISEEEKENVCIARTLFSNPKIILLREPREKTVERISEYAKDKNAILIIFSKKKVSEEEK